jgi:hypothetical protein
MSTRLTSFAPQFLVDDLERSMEYYRKLALQAAEYPSEAGAVWALRAKLTDEDQRRLEDLRQRDRQQYEEWPKR